MLHMQFCLPGVVLHTQNCNQPWTIFFQCFKLKSRLSVFVASCIGCCSLTDSFPHWKKYSNHNYMLWELGMVDIFCFHWPPSSHSTLQPRSPSSQRRGQNSLRQGSFCYPFTAALQRGLVPQTYSVISCFLGWGCPHWRGGGQSCGYQSAMVGKLGKSWSNASHGPQTCKIRV